MWTESINILNKKDDPCCSQIEGCEHCKEGVKIGNEFYIEISENLLKGGYDDVEINYCPICGWKLK